MDNEMLKRKTKSVINLIMDDNEEYFTNCIVDYLSEFGIKVERNREGLQKAKNFLDSKGWELEIKATNLEITEETLNTINANQIIRLKLKPKLIP